MLGSSTARQLGSSTARQLGRLGSPAAKEVMEDALWPGSRNIHALTWPTFAARRNCSSTARQVGQPGGKGSHRRCAVARLSKHPRPDLAKYRRPSISREKFPILPLSACPRLDSTAIKDEEAPQGASFSCLNNSEDCFLLHLH